MCPRQARVSADLAMLAARIDVPQRMPDIRYKKKPACAG
jgi:hypothetical protein